MPIPQRRRVLRAMAAIAATGAVPSWVPRAWAQAYPTHPVHYVVGYPPGGTSDLVARAITPGLSTELGQPFVVDNRPGGNGVVATELVQKSPPDGYTLLHTSVSFFTVTPQLLKVTYDPFKDFDPVGMIGTNVNVLVVNPSLPVKTFPEFVAYAKANPGKLFYGTSGSGTGAHILIEYLKQQTGINAVHVPYKGAAPALNDLIGGRVQFEFDPAVTPMVQAGKLRALAISGAKSLDLLPGVPPIEQFLPNWNPPQFYNFVSAPAGTPIAIRERINAALVKTLAEPKVAKLLRDNNYEPGTARPDELLARLKADYALTGKVLRDNNIKLD
ncbi:MAG TPA: tripartite tricarboxylate transporter substrate binding protein [Casimicrobiaceae bacterium]|nr:tripartite tricarboxylate transporter substrate binding protein [Casimicrobiaceae bacterium]